jgi:hypothetical protein
VSIIVDNEQEITDEVESQLEDTPAAETRETALFRAKINRAISYLAAVNMPAFTALLQISDIKIVRKGTPEGAFCPTAMLTRGKHNGVYEIVFNEDFCSQFDTKALAGVLFHELLHHIMRHLELPNFPDPKLANIVADAFINRTIAQTEPSLVGFARKFYKEDESPELFLRPRSKPTDLMDKQIYRHLYKGNVSETDLYDYLDRRVPKQKCISVVLVGGHGDEGQSQPGAGEVGEEGGDNPLIQAKGQGDNPLSKEDVPELVREIKDKLRQRDSNLSGQLAGHFDKLLQDFIRVNKLDRNATMEEAFRLSLVDSMKADLLNDVLGSVQESGSQSVLMPERPARSDMILTAMGVPVFFWKNPDYMEPQGDVRVYVDVSGSVSGYQDWIYGVILALEEYLYTNIYLFSNDVAEVTVGEFAEGKVVSTYGTDFNCVLNHILEHNVEKAVVVTDGYASASQDLVAKVKEKQVEIFSVVVEPDGNRYQRYGQMGVESFSDKVFNLPKA